MKANELRIGNFVYAFRAVWTIDNSDFANLEAIETYDFIPLTEEWFLKAGFEKSFKNDFWYSIKINDKRLLVSILGNIEIEKWDRTMIAFHDICKYVHQLQNLYFTLCGEELVFSTEQ